MDVIGASLLANYAAERPEASPTLAALHAIVREARWTCREDIERQFRVIARFEDSQTVSLFFDDAGLRATLKVNYALGLVQIASVQPTHEPRR
jgi:mRNA-degrading endonuclease HigB of HigAB toxin-antitoxin module